MVLRMGRCDRASRICELGQALQSVNPKKSQYPPLHCLKPMNQKNCHHKTKLIGFLLLTTSAIFAFQPEAKACEKPRPGKYWLGWGEARLIVPSTGEPYQEFRGERYILPGRYCLSGDNTGVTRQESNGKIWAYTKSPD